jgi:hypothetical protein
MACGAGMTSDIMGTASMGKPTPIAPLTTPPTQNDNTPTLSMSAKPGVDNQWSHSAAAFKTAPLPRPNGHI